MNICKNCIYCDTQFSFFKKKQVSNCFKQGFPIQDIENETCKDFRDKHNSCKFCIYFSDYDYACFNPNRFIKYENGRVAPIGADYRDLPCEYFESIKV